MEGGRQSQRGALPYSVLLSVFLRPVLWPTAISQMFRLAPTGWYRRPPFLPLPSSQYLDFRLMTQYGGESSTLAQGPLPRDVIHYLRWCRDWNRTR